MIWRTNVALVLFRLLIAWGMMDASTFQGMTLAQSRAEAAESADIYISLSAVGGFPENRSINLTGGVVSETTIHNGVGGAFKVGLFPDFTYRALGIELEYFGTSGKISAQVFQSGGQAQASSGLIVLNSMANLVLRQPTGEFRPYVGAGIGYSGGILHGADFPGRTNQDFDSTTGLTYQFLGGLHWDLVGQSYLFAEYKYLATSFHWKGLALDYRANYVLLGIGWNF